MGQSTLAFLKPENLSVAELHSAIMAKIDPCAVLRRDREEANEFCKESGMIYFTYLGINRRLYCGIFVNDTDHRAAATFGTWHFYVSLPFCEGSQEIATMILHWFGGGFLEPNDCSGNKPYWVTGNSGEKPPARVVQIKRRDLERLLGGVVEIVDDANGEVVWKSNESK